MLRSQHDISVLIETRVCLIRYYRIKCRLSRDINIYYFLRRIWHIYFDWAWWFRWLRAWFTPIYGTWSGHRISHASAAHPFFHFASSSFPSRCGDYKYGFAPRDWHDPRHAAFYISAAAAWGITMTRFGAIWFLVSLLSVELNTL